MVSRNEILFPSTPLHLVGFTKQRPIQDINSVALGTTTNPNIVFLFFGEAGLLGPSTSETFVHLLAIQCVCFVLKTKISTCDE